MQDKNTKSFVIKHDYNAGDLITILPGLQKLYEETGMRSTIYQRLNLPAFYYNGATHPVTDATGNHVTMNKAMFEFIKPLLLYQEYIDGFHVWNGEESDFDFALSRDQKSVPMPHGSIHHWPMITFPQLNCDLSQTWIHAAGPCNEKYDNKIVINRTQRYYNPNISYHFLKDLQQSCIFVGTETEHKVFCFEFGLNIEHYQPKTALQLAVVLIQSKLFIGNQSFCWHLADAMKVRRLLEVSPQMPNTWPTGKDGYIFAHQNTLNYFVSLFTKH